MPAANQPENLTEIETALRAFASTPLAEASLGLLETHGYESDRRMKPRSNTAQGFLAPFDHANTLSHGRALVNEWQQVEFLFQLTDSEVKAATT